MPNVDVLDHPVVQALDATIDALTYLREGGTKQVALDAEVWKAFNAPMAPSRSPVQATPLPQVPEPTRVTQGSTKDTPDQRNEAMDALKQLVMGCQGCPHASADQRFLGQGVVYNPPVAIVNGAALIGEDVTAQGSRLEGDAGVLLEKMFGAIGLKLEDLYLTHAMKCAVQKKPDTSALQACAKHLRCELQMVQPKAIVLLGPVAAKALFVKGIGAMGTVGQWNLLTVGGVSIPTITLHHPMRLLMLGDALAVPLKQANWAALQALRERLKG